MTFLAWFVLAVCVVAVVAFRVRRARYRRWLRSPEARALRASVDEFNVALGELLLPHATRVLDTLNEFPEDPKGAKK